MKILLYGINYSPELTGIGKYSGEMATWLAANGHEVRVVTAPPYYPDWEIQKPYKNRYFSEEYDGAKVTRCPLYIPKALSSLKRILHLLSFSLSSFPAVLRKAFWRPSVIFCVVPTLFCFPAALLLARISGAKLILHIQDYEVDAMLGLGMSGNGFFGRVARAYEFFALKRADLVTTISGSMMRKAVEKGVSEDRVKLFPNWSDVETFLDVSAEQEELVRQRLNLLKSKKICLYSGNIGEKQGLEVVVQAAKSFVDDDIQFVFVGQGAGLAKLKASVKLERLENVSFFPLQPLEDLPALLKLADCHLVIQKKGAADAVMPSKLTNILSVGGQALITAEGGTELGELCHECSGIAELVEPENSESLIFGIQRVLAKPKFNSVAQNYAKEYLKKNAVLSNFESLMTSS